MAVRTIRKSWWIDFRFNHRRYRKRSPENSRAGARAYEAVLRQKLARGESLDDAKDTEQRSQTFERFAWEWFEQYVVPNNKISEQYAKRFILTANLIPFFGRMGLSEIKASHIERYKAKQVASGFSNKTINNRLTVLRKCLRCAHEWFGTDVPSIKLLRCPQPKTDFLTDAECDLLLLCATGQLHEIVLVALRTGMRLGEIRGLQWSSIDWQNRSLTVRHSRCDLNKSLGAPKNNRERHIPLDADVYETLLPRRRTSGYVFINERSGEPLTGERLTRDLGTICKEAKVRKIGWHVLRHTFATQLTLRSVPLTVVKELLGHSSIVMTMRYSHVAPSSLRSAIEVLSPRNVGIADLGQPAGNQWQRVTGARVSEMEASSKQQERTT